MSLTFRLILDPPRDAALNMAIDELLMESQSLSEPPPVLRFYSWSEPAYSAGYFQNVAEIVKRFRCVKKNISVVKRFTGGGLVFHGKDLTFSLSMKDSDHFFLGNVKDSYLKVNEALRSGLKPAFPDIDYADCRDIPSGRGDGGRVCFEAPSCYDLLLHGKKVVGASQRRKGGAILHQSSVFLNGDESILRRHILEGFMEKWKIDFFEKPLSAEELFAAQQKKERYASSEWAYLPGLNLERSFLS